MNRYWIVVFAVWLLAESAAKGREYEAPSIEEVLSRQRQNRDAFIDVQLEFRWSVKPSEAFVESRVAEQRMVKELFEADALPGEILQEIQALEDKGVPASAARRQVLDRVVAELTLSANGKDHEDRYNLHLRNSDVQLKIYLNLARDNPRRDSALKRHVTSFTGGDFKLVERLHGEKWLGLEPFPGIRNTNRNAWAQSILRIDTMLPPYINGLDLGLETYIYSIDMALDSSQGKIFPAKTTTGAVQEKWIVVQAERDRRFLLCMVDESREFCPDWVATFESVVDLTLENINSDLVNLLVQQVQHFRDANSTDERHQALPELIVYFEDYAQIPHAAWYPRRVVRMPLAQFSTVESLRSGKPTDAPFGVREVGELRVEKITANEDVEAIPKLTLEDGTVFLDLDSNVSKVIGESPDAAINRILHGQTRGPRSIWLFVINAIAIIVLVFVWVRRQFWKNTEK